MKTLQIRKTELLQKSRKIKVTLNNGTVVKIESCYESWQQYGGNREELFLTMPIAEKYNNWLHGGDLP
jgi:hypothetical protein